MIRRYIPLFMAPRPAGFISAAALADLLVSNDMSIEKAAEIADPEHPEMFADKVKNLIETSAAFRYKIYAIQCQKKRIDPLDYAEWKGVFDEKQDQSDADTQQAAPQR